MTSDRPSVKCKAEFAAALNMSGEQFLQRMAADFRNANARGFSDCGSQHRLRLQHDGCKSERRTNDKGGEIRLRYTKRALEPRAECNSDTHATEKRAGYKIGLLSNCSIEIPILWPETEFADLVESPIFSSRERLKKPDPRIYHLACERLAVIPEHRLYIADGENHELGRGCQTSAYIRCCFETCRGITVPNCFEKPENGRVRLSVRY